MFLNKNYEDDFDDDFEKDESEQEEEKKRPKERKYVDSNDDDQDDYKSNRRRNIEKSSRYDDRYRSRDQYDDYEDYGDNESRRGRVVKANAHVNVPTDLVEVHSSEMYFNHDSRDRQKRRAKDLFKNLIELDKKAFSLLDINPVQMRTVYSTHLKHVGFPNYLVMVK